MDRNLFRWGIFGCGTIAPRFFKALEKTGHGHVIAAASKSIRRAKWFQKKTGVARIYNSYEAMLDSEQLDAVYIANTHNFHSDSALLCLDRRIPVLIEKAFTQNAQQAAAVISRARTNETFAMEAMWTRFNPGTLKVRELLQSGTIGDMQSMEADFRVRMHPLSPKMWPWNRMYSPRLAGGALLDIGIYPVSYASMVFGRAPSAISSSAKITWSGVDKTSEYRFGYPSGSTATIKSSFTESGSRNLILRGSTGSIEVPNFYRADQLIVRCDGKAEETIQCNAPGFEYQIREVHRCLKEEQQESPVMPLDESLEIMKTLDAIRTQWDMKYPGE